MLNPQFDKGCNILKVKKILCYANRGEILTSHILMLKSNKTSHTFYGQLRLR